MSTSPGSRSPRDARRPAAASAPGADAVSPAGPLSSETGGQRLLTAVLAGLLLVATFVPWWISELPLALTASWLNLWTMLATGLSLPPLGAATGLNWLGNALFGLIGTLPSLALLIALVVRLARPATVSTKLLRRLGILAALGAIWIFIFAWNRQDAANGRSLTSIGPWLALVLGIAAAVLAHLWWQREKRLLPPIEEDADTGGADSEEGRLEGIVGFDLDGDGEIARGEDETAATRRGRRSRTSPEHFAFEPEDSVDDDEPDTASIRIDTLREELARDDEGDRSAR